MPPYAGILSSAEVTSGTLEPGGVASRSTPSDARRQNGPLSRQWPKSLLRILPPLAQNASATPMSEPPATTPDATGRVNSSAIFGSRLSIRSATRAPRKNKLRLSSLPHADQTANGLWPGVRPPRFRRDPFVRDVALDPGRATAPRITAPHMWPSTNNTGSAPATFRISWLNPTPHTIAVYASPLPSPTDAQHSLAGGRYPLPAPDFHRLDLASFAWRTLFARKPQISLAFDPQESNGRDVLRIDPPIG